ncbi:MAG TPA: Maf family protein [Anaerolineae bacterium]|nr:Maf family protein [Anaerolineae bacterium]
MFSRTGKAVTRLVLASGSPRRRELLQLLGLPFRVVVPRTVEGTVQCSDAATQASVLAEMKALSVARHGPEEIIVAADTLVVLRDQVIGKPTDAASARDTLVALRTGEHQVVTGLAVVLPGASTPSLQAVETRVWMRQYGEEEIASYIDRGEPFDKAGAYAIQDPEFDPVERIEGCYANVMGLPLCHLFTILRDAAVPHSLPPVAACEGHTGRRCFVAARILQAANHGLCL